MTVSGILLEVNALKVDYIMFLTERGAISNDLRIQEKEIEKNQILGCSYHFPRLSDSINLQRL